jgi:hypothetical protein
MKSIPKSNSLMERKLRKLTPYFIRNICGEIWRPGIFEKKVSQFSWCKLLQIILK